MGAAHPSSEMDERSAVASHPGSGKLAVLLADDTRFWRAAAVCFAAIAILKGVRGPSLWAATQANLDYHHGFIKRGLFGQLARSAGLPITRYDVFALLSGALLLILLALLGRWISKSGVRRLGQGAVVAVFAASYALTYLAHLIGYLEIPLAILALLALSIRVPLWQLIGVLVLGSIGVLIHESYVVTFLPMTLLPAVLTALTSRGNRLRALLPAAGCAAAIVVVLLVVAAGASMTVARATSLQAEMTAAVDFTPRADVFPILTRSAIENVVWMLHMMMSSGRWWMAQCNAFVMFMPTTAFFLWISLRIVDTHHPQAERLPVKTAIVFASLCPLLMQLTGWDIYRWYGLAALSSFVCTTIVCNHYRATVADGSRTLLRNTAVLLIGVNLATGGGLFDGYRVDTFPFVDFWKAVIHTIVAGGHFNQPGS